jgi:Enoyl-CoA hydratase/isomerase
VTPSQADLAAGSPGLVQPDQLADVLWFAASGDPGGFVAAAPVLVDLSVPLASHDQLVSRTLRAARCSAQVLIGVASGTVPQANRLVAQELTISLIAYDAVPSPEPAFVAVKDPLAAAQELAEVVRARPIATASLAVLLQQTALLPVWEGLVAESATYSTLLAGPEFASWLAARPSVTAPPDTDEPVLASRRGNVLTLTLNRPERRNAYGRGVRDALVTALQVARIDEAVTVELEGRGPAFCSGGDLAEFGTAPDPAGAHLVRLRHGAAQLLHDLGPRTTARLHGACIGAGIELPAFAGRVIASPDTQIALPEVAMGLVPGAGGTVSIVRRIGRWRTAWLALSGKRLSAAQAMAWGLVDEVAGP